MDKDFLQNMELGTIGIKLHHSHPAGCEKESVYEHVWLNRGLTSNGMRSEDSVPQGKDIFCILVSTGSASSA